MAQKHDVSGHMTKEELQEDAFVEGAIKAASYAKQNRKSLITALILVIIVGFGIRMYMAYRAEVQGQANVLLNRGTTLFAAEEYDLAMEFFNRVSNEFAGSNAAGYAVYYQAMTAFRNGDLETAGTNWQLYLDKYRSDEMISAVSTAGLAVCSESRGEYVQAAALFHEAAMSSRENIWASRHLFQAALCLERADQTVEALAMLEFLQKEYPESPEIRDIEMYMEPMKYKIATMN